MIMQRFYGVPVAITLFSLRKAKPPASKTPRTGGGRLPRGQDSGPRL